LFIADKIVIMNSIRITKLAASVIAAVLLMVVPCQGQGRDREADLRLDFARQMMNTNMPQSAIVYYHEFINEYPNHPRIAEARYGLARALELVGDSGAIEAYRNFLKKHSEDPKAVSARFELAMSLYNSGLWAEARSAFSDFSARYPSNPSSLKARYFEAQSLLKTNRHLEAVKIFKDVSDSAKMPLKAEAAYMAAASQWQAGLENEAAGALAAVSSSYPGTEVSAKADALTGDILFRQKQFIDAIKFYTRALDAKPQLSFSDEISYWRAWARIKSGDTEAGVKELAEFDAKFSQSSRRSEALKQAALLYSTLGKKNAAIEIWKRFLKTENSEIGLAEANYELGLLYFEMNDDAASSQFFSEVLHLNKILIAEAGYMLGQLELRASRFSTADAFLKVAERATDDAELIDRIQILRLEALKASGNAASFREIMKSMEERRSPALAGAIRGNAELIEAQGDLNGALKEYSRVIEKFPGGVDANQALFKRGLVYYQLARYSEAEKDFLQFIDVVQKLGANELLDDAWYWIGFSRYQLGLWAKSIEAFRASADLPGSDKKLSALLRAGNAAFSMKDYNEAINYFTEVIQNSTDTEISLDALFNKAESLRSLGMSNEARELYLETWRLGGADYEEALLNAAGTLEEIGKSSEAAESYESAAQLISNSSLIEEALMDAARLRQKLGDDDGALRNFEKVAENDGAGTPEALFSIGELRFDRGETEAAVRALKIARDTYSVSIYGRRSALVLANRIMDSASALNSYEALIKSAPDDPISAEAKLRMGLIARNAGRIDIAISLLKKAVSQISDKSILFEAKLALGELLLERKKFTQARIQLEFIYRSPLYSDNALRPASGIALAKAFMGQNQKTDALNILKEIADRYSEYSDEAKRLIEELESKR